jgi:hypothetical protein
MSVLGLSRWQFGITTVYHFIFVPLTLSLSYLVAVMQTPWRVKKDDVYLRMTKFFGKIRLGTAINPEGLDQVDEIVVLDHGRIAERGTHTQLVGSGGTYQRLWEASR